MYRCLTCGADYSKKLIHCPKCGSVNERRLGLVRDLERKVCQNPQIGLKCRKCGTLFPNDTGKCPYCTTPSDCAIKLSSMKGTITITTPITRHYKWRGYNIRLSNDFGRTVQKPSLSTCAVCNAQVSTEAELCPHCGQPTGVHICPNCRSTNTEVISNASKATSIFLWGPFATNKVLSKFQCKDCGHKF